MCLEVGGGVVRGQLTLTSSKSAMFSEKCSKFFKNSKFGDLEFVIHKFLNFLYRYPEVFRYKL